jgi:hypothetical protein
MSNHLHLIAAPELADGLALAFRNAHGRYAAYWNTIQGVQVGMPGKGGAISDPSTKYTCGLGLSPQTSNIPNPRQASLTFASRETSYSASG